MTLRIPPVLLALALSACIDQSAAASIPANPRPPPAPARLALDVPAESEIRAIKLSAFSNSAKQRPVTDRATIHQVMDFVRTHNTRWTRLSGRFPNPQTSAALYDDASTMRLVLWFGDGWIGATDFHKSASNSLMWNLPAHEQQQLRLMLGVKQVKPKAAAPKPKPKPKRKS